MNDNISDDIKCVKKICVETEKLGKRKFSAWMAWNAYCKNIRGDPQYSVDECFRNEL